MPGIVHSNEFANSSGQQQLFTDMSDYIEARIEAAKSFAARAEYEAAKHSEDSSKANSKDNSADNTAIQNPANLSTTIKINQKRQSSVKQIVQHKLQSADEFYMASNFYQAAKIYIEVLYFSNYDFSPEERMQVAKKIVTALKEDELLGLTHNILFDKKYQKAARIKLAKALSLMASANIALSKNDIDQTETDGTEADVADADSSTSNNPDKEKNLHRLRGRNYSNNLNTALLRKAQAAKLYLDALELEQNAFDTKEILRIAKWLRTIDWLENSVEILERLCLERPLSIDARLELARSRIALEQYALAHSVLDDALSMDNANQDALLVRASALRKQRRYSEAIDQYRLLINKENDFDARFGLASTLFSAGKKNEAAAILAEIKTNDESQLEQMYELSRYLAKSTRPTIELSYSQYEDSDKNQLKNIGIMANTSISRYDLITNYWHKSAVGEIKTISADTFSVGVGTYITNEIKLLGKLGVTQANLDDSSVEPVGQLKVDIQKGTAKIIANLSRETLTSTASIIEREIQLSQASVQIIQPLPYRTNFRGIYTRKFFSDDNTANDYQVSILARLNRRLPFMSIGFAYHYMDFDHPAKNFYFDPQGYSAKKVILNAYWAKATFFINLEIDLGQQKYSRNNYPGKQNFGYGNISSGVNLSRHWAIGLTIEWSNAAAEKTETPEVYDDFLLAMKTSYMF